MTYCCKSSHLACLEKLTGIGHIIHMGTFTVQQLITKAIFKLSVTKITKKKCQNDIVVGTVMMLIITLSQMIYRPYNVVLGGIRIKFSIELFHMGTTFNFMFGQASTWMVSFFCFL